MHLIQLINVVKCILIHLLSVGSDVLSPSTLVMEVLWMLCEQTECATECLYQTPVIEKLLTPVIALLNGQKVTSIPTRTHTPFADYKKGF